MSLEELDAMIARCRRLGRMNDDVAAAAAPGVLGAIMKTAKAGTKPDGKPWPPRKDGGQALQNVASHLSVKADGSTIRVTLTGKAEVVHNFGDHRNPRRQVLPNGGESIPSGVKTAVLDAARKVFEGGAP